MGDSWVGKNPPGFDWSLIGVRIGLVDFHQITKPKTTFLTLKLFLFYHFLLNF